MPPCQARDRPDCPLTCGCLTAKVCLSHHRSAPFSPTHHRDRQGRSAVNHKTSQMYQTAQSGIRKPATVLHYRHPSIPFPLRLRLAYSLNLLAYLFLLGLSVKMGSSRQVIPIFSTSTIGHLTLEPRPLVMTSSSSTTSLELKGAFHAQLCTMPGPQSV